MSTKRKAECTPEEWERIKANARERYRTDPEYRQRRLDQCRKQAKTERYRIRDRARYDEKRKGYIRQGHIRRKYGLTPEIEAKLMALQQGCCAVCGVELVASGNGAKHRHVDHDHATKKIRGFLCGRCNVAEGYIRALGLTPAEFANRLQAYLDSPPADQITDEGETLW